MSEEAAVPEGRLCDRRKATYTVVELAEGRWHATIVHEPDRSELAMRRQR